MACCEDHGRGIWRWVGSSHVGRSATHNHWWPRWQERQPPWCPQTLAARRIGRACWLALLSFHGLMLHDVVCTDVNGLDWAAAGVGSSVVPRAPVAAAVVAGTISQRHLVLLPPGTPQTAFARHKPPILGIPTSLGRRCAALEQSQNSRGLALVGRCHSPAASSPSGCSMIARAALLLGLALLAHCQPIPPQCDPAALAKPTNVSFLGPARTITVGEGGGTDAPPRPPPPPPPFSSAAATTVLGERPQNCRPSLAWSSAASGIAYNYHQFGKATSRPALVLVQGLGTTQYGWPLEVGIAMRICGEDTPRCVGLSSLSQRETQAFKRCPTRAGPAPALFPLQALQELATTRQVIIFDNALVGLSGAPYNCAGLLKALFLLCQVWVKDSSAAAV